MSLVIPGCPWSSQDSLGLGTVGLYTCRDIPGCHLKTGTSGGSSQGTLCTWSPVLNHCAGLYIGTLRDWVQVCIVSKMWDILGVHMKCPGRLGKYHVHCPQCFAE